MYGSVSRIIRFILTGPEPTHSSVTRSSTKGFKHLVPEFVPSVIAQKREDFDAMRAYQAMLLTDFQQFLGVIQNTVVGIGFIFVSAAGARISGNLKPIIASAIAIVVTALFLAVASLLFASYREKILRDCEIYAGHRDRYLVQMQLLGLYEPHETGTYGAIASCLNQPFSVRAGKGTEQTLSLMKLIRTLATIFVVAGCLLTISVAFNEDIGRLWDCVAAKVKGYGRCAHNQKSPANAAHQMSEPDVFSVGGQPSAYLGNAS